LAHWKALSGLPNSDNRTFSTGVTVKALRGNIDNVVSVCNKLL